MSPKIKVLPDTLINKIAAGEVVERPASVVKELIENSIDAKATEIFVDVVNAGRRMIRVSDNGEGMHREDALLAFEKHATSKITKEADLFDINTLGFRGEALPSIASVSKVRIITRPADADTGILVETEDGKIKKTLEAGAPVGTLIEAADLFYNTPARLKFLKSENTELSHIIALVNQQAIANPHIHFRLSHNNKELLNFSRGEGEGVGVGGSISVALYQRIYQVYGEDFLNNMSTISGEENGIRIYGLISKPSFSRADKSHQDIFLNRRHIKNNIISRAIYDAFYTLLPKDRYPVAVIFIDIPPSQVDVNVHPTKREVRFLNQTAVYEAVKKIVKDGLLKGDAVAEGGRVNYLIQRGSKGHERREFLVSSPDADYERQSGYAIEGARVMGQGAAELSNQPIQLSQLTECNVIPLGQIDNTYIVADSSGELWLIDQHAAGERILYERLKNSYNNNKIEIQQLLIPEQITLTSAESVILKDYIGILSDIGIEIEAFGADSYVIRGIPSLLGNNGIKQLLLDIIDGLNSFQRRPERNEIVDKIIILMACHGAIRANHGLSNREMLALIEDLMDVCSAFTCPHGRPIVIKFTKTDLEKMFKRR
jgi:DNA mismatch repair protein MutL